MHNRGRQLWWVLVMVGILVVGSTGAQQSSQT